MAQIKITQTSNADMNIGVPKKLTAVEWLDRWFRDNPEATHQEGNKALEQAKQMEKEQIMQSYNDGKSAVIHIEENKSLEQYYNETYNNEK